MRKSAELVLVIKKHELTGCADRRAKNCWRTHSNEHPLPLESTATAAAAHSRRKGGRKVTRKPRCEITERKQEEASFPVLLLALNPRFALAGKMSF